MNREELILEYGEEIIECMNQYGCPENNLCSCFGNCLDIRCRCNLHMLKDEVDLCGCGQFRLKQYDKKMSISEFKKYYRILKIKKLLKNKGN